MLVDPVWHQLSGKTKQLIADLKTLREMLQWVLLSILYNNMLLIWLTCYVQVYSVFSLLVTVKWLSVKTAPEMTYTVWGWALNSAQSNVISGYQNVCLSIQWAGRNIVADSSDCCLFCIALLIWWDSLFLYEKSKYKVMYKLSIMMYCYLHGYVPCWPYHSIVCSHLPALSAFQLVLPRCRLNTYGR